MKGKKRSVEVKILSWYFILQGWVALGYFGEKGTFALVFVALFFSIGIGMLKLFKPAYIACLILCSLVIIWCGWIMLSNFNLIIEKNPMIGKPIAGVILFSIPLFILTRKRIREQFK